MTCWCMRPLSPRSTGRPGSSASARTPGIGGRRTARQGGRRHRRDSRDAARRAATPLPGDSGRTQATARKPSSRDRAPPVRGDHSRCWRCSTATGRCRVAASDWRRPRGLLASPPPHVPPSAPRGCRRGAAEATGPRGEAQQRADHPVDREVHRLARVVHATGVLVELPAPRLEIRCTTSTPVAGTACRIRSRAWASRAISVFLDTEAPCRSSTR